MTHAFSKDLLVRSPLFLAHIMLWSSFGACLVAALFFDVRRWIG